jgi:hypothetical protein
MTPLAERRRRLDDGLVHLILRQFDQQLDPVGLDRVRSCIEEATGQRLSSIRTGNQSMVLSPTTTQRTHDAFKSVRESRSAYALMEFIDESKMAERRHVCVRYSWSRNLRREAIVIEIPTSFAAPIDRMLACACDSSCALWAGWTPPGDEAVIENKLQRMVGQDWNQGDPTARAFEYLPRQLSDLPILSTGLTDERSIVPSRVHWVNYWSALTASRLGFPDSRKDQELLPNSFQTAKGAWVMKLTTAPLDLEREDHVRALVSAYHRFEISG